MTMKRECCLYIDFQCVFTLREVFEKFHTSLRAISFVGRKKEDEWVGETANDLCRIRKDH